MYTLLYFYLLFFSLFFFSLLYFFFFFFNDTATTEIYTLSLHDALPIFDDSTEQRNLYQMMLGADFETLCASSGRSEEHTSELQSRFDLVCRLLLEKKKKKIKKKK